MSRKKQPSSARKSRTPKEAKESDTFGLDELEKTAGIPGAIHKGEEDIEEEVAESRIGVENAGRGAAGESSSQTQ
jgi:hypothetical protein